VLKLKLKCALVLVIILVVLTLCLRGVVPEKTYTYSEIPASAVHTSIVSYDLWNGAEWSVYDFSVDIGNWRKYEQNITGFLSSSNGLLNLTAVFNYSQGHQFVVLERSLDIDVSELPIFSINVSVSEGVVYHVRFVGIDSDGVYRDVWWESSPLDDISGKSMWETHFVDLVAFSEQAVGSPVSKLTLVSVILDSSPFGVSDGEKSLCISHIGFSARNLKVSRIPGDAQFISSETPFQAVIIELPYTYAHGWGLKWSSVTYTLTSGSEFEYAMLLLSKNSGVLQVGQGSVFISHEDVVVDIYRLDAIPGVVPSYEELTLLQPFLSPYSIVIMKKGFDPGGFDMFKLDSIELVASNENPQSAIDNEQVSSMAFGLIVAVIAVPVLLLAVAFRFKQYLAERRSVLLVAFVAYGIVCRLALAPFVGHPYDMEVWTQASRLFYESGVLNIRTFPLPFNCYLLLLGYSPYALLRLVGFQDVGFLSHTFGMLEAVFIKAPFIVSDLLSFYFLYKILNRTGGGKLDLSGRFPHALLYFLCPLAIVLSGVWGMYDGIAVALFLAGIYYSLFEKKPFRGAAFYVLSGLTKAFGFLGLIPIGFSLLKEKKYVQLLAMFGLVSTIVFLLYLPLLAVTGLQAAPELFMQFIRGRIGLGSVSSYVPSTSYMSYLSLSGFDVTSPYLTHLLIALVLFISIYFGLKSRGAKGETYVRLTLGYFAVVLFVFYLLFFRVYEQYYLWVIPILIIYSYLTKESGFALAALGLSVVVLPVWSFSVFLTGTEYYWIPLNLPADTAIIAILPSAIVALSLIGLTCLKGPFALLKTWKGMLISAIVTLWFSFGFAYYVYYGFLPLGVFWYFASSIIILATAVFLFKKFGSKEPATASVG
jgi:Gpi18-like mannosyltransferase